MECVDDIIVAGERHFRHALLSYMKDYSRHAAMRLNIESRLTRKAGFPLGCWRSDYNGSRPHSQIGRTTSSEFASIFHPRRDLALRYADGSPGRLGMSSPRKIAGLATSLCRPKLSFVQRGKGVAQD
jgi:hypothetical protein